MNKVLLSGRLTRDAEIRNADSDKKVARCTLAVNRDFKKEGEEPNADFIGIVGFKNQADFLENFGKKGVKFIVIGRIQTGSYEKDGGRVYTTDVIAERIEFAENKKSSEEGAGDSGDGFSNIPDGFDDSMPFN
ncbi:single-stranded DNA-binding protein [Butyrivibrio proteoclasticus]|uniref:single-stranded DNA-binding protein n=1 Tax=Butyrivibrio proteoclasticus TaxID=43305 RepID=UPI00047C79BD|nr:single-stranded DNA-binding protein [Butyrivibrio proteoclasticus]